QEGPRARLTGGGAVRQAAGFLDPSRVFSEAQGPGQKAQRPKALLDALPHDLRLALDQKVRRGHPLALLSSACVHPPETVRSLPAAEAALGTVDRTARLSYIILQNRGRTAWKQPANSARSEEHTSELQSRENLVCRLLLEKKNK